MTLKRISLLACFLLLLSGLGLGGPVLDPKLAPLAPLLNKDWRGMMKAPDGSAKWETTCRFDAVWGGRVIKYSRTTPERNSFEEGFVYWDDAAKKPAFFSIVSNAVFTAGFISVDKNVITFEGQMTWPSAPSNPQVKQRYDFRNTFEFLAESEMVDRWFQDAFGPWQPGHVITFRAGKEGDRDSGRRPAEFDPERWDLSSAKAVDHLGRRALAGTAFLKDVSLTNGVIEVDIVTADKSRSYPGVLFRVKDASNYERVYIRPHRSPFYDDAIQYAPMFNGVDSWQLYHGPGRTAALDIPPDRWNHMKIMIAGDQARVFWNGGAEPALIIDQLARGVSAGTIGLSGPTDGTAYFSHFSYTADDHRNLPPVAAREPVSGAIRAWTLSAPFPMLTADFAEYPKEAFLAARKWQAVEADESGLVDVSRYHPRANRAGDCILAKTVLNADADTLLRVGFGYSDVITVFLNGRPVYSGNSAYQSRDRSFLGVVGWFDNLFLPLKKGTNELLVQVGESSGGWAFCFRKEDEVFAAEGMAKAWTLKGPFSMPESIVYDPARGVCYVSNYFHEGRESISKISPAGEVLAPEWITGLQRPTGMCVKDSTLYVVDRSGLVAVDTDKGEIKDRIPLPGARMPNDVAMDPDGNLYVSDTAGNAVFRCAGGKLEKWLEGLDGPNGLLCERDRLLIGQNEKLLAADLATRALTPLADFEPGSNIDGLQSDGQGHYLVSDYRGKLYLVSAGGDKTVLLDTATPGVSIADFAFVPSRGLFIIPTLSDNRAVAYSWNRKNR
jgi:hypothetical protein